MSPSDIALVLLSKPGLEYELTQRKEVGALESGVRISLKKLMPKDYTNLVFTQWFAAYGNAVKVQSFFSVSKQLSGLTTTLVLTHNSAILSSLLIRKLLNIYFKQRTMRSQRRMIVLYG